MRAYLPGVYSPPRRVLLAEALSCLAEPPHLQLASWQPLAGGT